MKMFHKKGLVLLVCVTLLLTITVSGTVAFLADNSGPVVNEFKPSNVTVDITDKVDGDVKKNVVVTNESNIPVYIRVAVIASWRNASGSIVAPWNHYDGLGVNTSLWTRGSDGYYYYNVPVAPGASVTLFTQYKQPSPPVGVGEDVHLEMDIITQAIQADGMGANNAQEAFAKAAQTNAGK